jgi:hypothetical protein
LRFASGQGRHGNAQQSDQASGPCRNTLPPDPAQYHAETTQYQSSSLASANLLAQQGRPSPGSDVSTANTANKDGKLVDIATSDDVDGHLQNGRGRQFFCVKITDEIAPEKRAKSRKSVTFSCCDKVLNSLTFKRLRRCAS